MHNIAVISNKLKDANLSVTRSVIDLLLECGATVFVEEQYSDCFLRGCKFYNDFPDEAELIIVIGGDGSILDASLFAIDRDIPLIGVNMGKVGYLSEVEINNIGILKNIFSGNYKIYDKMLLSCEKIGEHENKFSQRLALNDVVISHSNYLGISEFSLCDEGDEIKYRADGLVISTPAGSTAYSLSAGGPVVSHELDSVLVTPVCPHSFFNRSILFSPSRSLLISNTGDDILNISIDGRCFTSIDHGESCRVFTSNKRVKFLSFKKNNMLSQVFKKMKHMEM